MNTYDHSLLLVLVTVPSEVHEKSPCFPILSQRCRLYDYLRSSFLLLCGSHRPTLWHYVSWIQGRWVFWSVVWTCMKSHGLDTATGWCCIPCSYMQVTKFKHHRVFSFHWRYPMCHVRATTKLTQLGPFWALHCSVQHCGRRGMAWLWF